MKLRLMTLLFCRILTSNTTNTYFMQSKPKIHFSIITFSLKINDEIATCNFQKKTFYLLSIKTLSEIKNA